MLMAGFNPYVRPDDEKNLCVSRGKVRTVGEETNAVGQARLTWLRHKLTRLLLRFKSGV
jgi:hypothetical protein